MSSTLATIKYLSGQGKIHESEADQVTKIYEEVTKFRASGAVTSDDKMEAKRSFQKAMLRQFGQARSTEIFKMMHRTQQQFSLQQQQQQHQHQQQHIQQPIQQQSLQQHLQQFNYQQPHQQNNQNNQSHMQQNNQNNQNNNSLQNNQNNNLNNNFNYQSNVLQHQPHGQQVQVHGQQTQSQQSYPNTFYPGQQQKQNINQGINQSLSQGINQGINQSLNQSGSQIYHVPSHQTTQGGLQGGLQGGPDAQAAQYPLLPQLGGSTVNSYNNGLNPSGQYQGQMYLSNDMSGMNNNGLSSGMHMSNNMQHQQQSISSQSLLAPIANYSIQELQQNQYHQRQSPPVWAPSPFNGDTAGMNPKGLKAVDGVASLTLPQTAFNMPTAPRTNYPGTSINPSLSAPELLKVNSEKSNASKGGEKKPRKARPAKKKGEEGGAGGMLGTLGGASSSSNNLMSGVEGADSRGGLGAFGGGGVHASASEGSIGVSFGGMGGVGGVGGEGTTPVGEESKVKAKRKYVRPAKKTESLALLAEGGIGGMGGGGQGEGDTTVVGKKTGPGGVTIKTEKKTDKGDKGEKGEKGDKGGEKGEKGERADKGERDDENEGGGGESGAGMKRKRDSTGRGSRGGKIRGGGRNPRAMSSPNPMKKTKTGSPSQDAGSVGEGGIRVKEEDITDQLEKPSMEGLQIVDKTLAADVVAADFIGAEEKAAKIKMRASLKGIKRPVMSARIGAAVAGGLGGVEDAGLGAQGVKMGDKIEIIEEDAVVAGVEFSFPHNIVDSSILEPLRITSEETGVTVSADVLEYLSYGLQMHLTNVIEACIKNSAKRRNVAGIKMYTNLHEKIHIKQEKPDAKTTLGIVWGPHVSNLLMNEEKHAREELKVREQEEEAVIVKEMRQFDEEKRASMVNGSKRGRTAQADIVESPWWVKEDAAEKAGLLDWHSLARAQFRQGVAREHSLGAVAVARRGGRAPGVKVESSSSSSHGGSGGGGGGGDGDARSSLQGGLGGFNRHDRDQRDRSDSIRDRSDSMDISHHGDMPISSFPSLSTSFPSHNSSHPGHPSLPSSPSSSARASREALLAAAQAHRTAALGVGLVGAGAQDIINRDDVMSVLSHSAVPKGGGPRSALLGLSLQRARWDI